MRRRRPGLPALLQRVSLWPRLVIGVTLGFVALYAVFSVLAVRAADASSSRIVRERLVIAKMVAADVDGILERSRVALAAAARAGVDDRSLAGSYDALAPMALALYDVSPTAGVRHVQPGREWVDAGAVTGKAFVARAAATRRFSVSAPFRTAAGRPAVAVGYPAHGTVLILVLDASSPSFMRPLFQAKRLGDTGHGELVGPRGIVIASTDRDDALHPGEHLPFYREMLRRRATSIQTVAYVEPATEGETRAMHVMAWSPVRAAPWGVAVGGTVADTYGPVERLRRTLLLAGAGALALLWLIALGGARTLVRPVRALTQAARDMASGDLEQRIAVVEGGEIGVLADSLESMRMQLRESLQTVRRWGEELEAKVEARTSDLRESNRQLAAVTAVATAGSHGSDLPSMLDACLDAILEHVRVDGAAVRLVDPREHRLGEARARGAMTGFACTTRTIALHDCPCGAAAADGKPRYGDRCTRCVDPRHSLAVLPLRAGQKIVGVLSVARDTVSPLSRDERRTLAAIADQLAVAVNGAQLLDELAAIQAQREVQRVKSDLIAAVSHELRTPLAFIKGYATTLLRDATADDATRRQFLEIIDDETTKLEGMVDELLDTSRLQSGRLEITPAELDLRPLIHDVAAKIRPHLATRGHELVVNEGPSLRAIADPLRVEQVLENLLENAARYSPPTAPIELDLRADERFVVVSVTDHGPGVPDDEHDRIFEPFFRGAAGRASTERGVGLGLAICAGLVEAQGGTLRVDRAPDGGARFAFSLPLA